MTFRSFACALALLAALAPAVAADDEIAETDRRAVRAVVESQLRAFADGRGADAFAHATPAIRAQFHDAATFMAMVRGSYPMLINPAAVSFFQPERRDAAVVVQGVQFRDRDGRLWRAVYQLERAGAGRWQIGGCAVAPDRESSTS